MLVVRIEMWPGGSQVGLSEIGRMYIHNVSKLSPISNYKGWVCRRGVFEPVAVSKTRATRELQVEGYPRERLNVWCLVTRALFSAFPEEARRMARGAAVDESLRSVAVLLGLPEEATMDEIKATISTMKTESEAYRSFRAQMDSRPKGLGSADSCPLCGSF